LKRFLSVSKSGKFPLEFKTAVVYIIYKHYTGQIPLSLGGHMVTTESSPGTIAKIAAREYTEDEKSIIEEIEKQYPDARDWRFDRVGNEFIDGNTYLVSFKTDEIKNRANSWYYAYVDPSGCRLLSNGDEAVVFMQALLEKRRGFLQRLRDFDLLDIIGALIALPITFTFVYIVATTKDSQNAISKEFLTIVSLILGYYFGRNKQK
jgi:hypothetical protein